MRSHRPLQSCNALLFIKPSRSICLQSGASSCGKHRPPTKYWLADSTGPHLNLSICSQRRAAPEENISFLKGSWQQTASETTSCRRRRRVSGYAGSLAGLVAGGREDERMTVMYCLWLNPEYNSVERGTGIWFSLATSDWRDSAAGGKTLKTGVSKCSGMGWPTLHNLNGKNRGTGEVAK